MIEGKRLAEEETMLHWVILMKIIRTTHSTTSAKIQNGLKINQYQAQMMITIYSVILDPNVNKLKTIV